MEYEKMAQAEDDGTLGHRTVAYEELHVRALLLELRALEQERQRLSTLAEAIVARYHAKGESLRQRADQIRTSVQTYLAEHNGGQALAFPDVGTAYLTTRKAKPKVVDAAALADWFETEQKLIEPPYHAPVFDHKTALELLLDEAGLFATPDGRIVDQHGEVFELPGVEVQPEGKTLAVRSA